MEKHIKTQFYIAIVLMSLVSGMCIYFLGNFQLTNKNLYEHSYTVSNKLKEVKISVHQISLSTMSIDQFDISGVELMDSANKDRLALIADQYSGDPEEVKRVHDTYEKWLSKRVSGKDKSTPEEHELFDDLLAAIEVLSSYTDIKAASLYAQAKKNTQYYAAMIGVLLIIGVVASIIMLLRTLQGFRTITVNRKQYLMLIDQNVMIAAIDDDGVIFDISNQLSRFLSRQKKELTGNQLKDIFFTDEDSQFDEMWRMVNSGTTWQGEIEIDAENATQWLGVDVLPMKSSNFGFSGYRLLAHDITHQKLLEQISITDTLTGLLNRRTLDETIERQTKLSFRSKKSLTIGILDVDFFKQFNDTYGHMSGDKVLTNLAAVWGRMLARPADFVFRIGGEEFCIIFNCGSVEESKIYIEKIREAVENLKIVHEKSTVYKYVTISIGATFFDGSIVADGKTLMSEADDNLYLAKETRNHTVQSVHGGALGYNLR